VFRLASRLEFGIQIEAARWLSLAAANIPISTQNGTLVEELCIPDKAK
jgi:hypothetical protein